MRFSIKEPIPEIFASWEALSAATDAYLAEDHDTADHLLRRANDPIVWSWLNPAWSKVDAHVVQLHPENDSFPVRKTDRDPDRNIRAAIRKTVLERDGYRCRYCGVPVISADMRKFLVTRYPDAVPWDLYDPSKQHAALSALWLQFDHVVPHSHGGLSDPDNVVVTCALCNFGKDRFTIRQLGIADPRDRQPVTAPWDGLERLRPYYKEQQAALRAQKKEILTAGLFGPSTLPLPVRRMAKKAQNV